MTRAVVVADGRLLTISSLEPRALGEVNQAMVVARLTDAVTGAAAAGPTSLTSTLSGLTPRATADAFVGLVGRPSRVVPALAAQDYPFEITFDVDGFAARTEQVTLTRDLTFPGTFTRADLGEVDLHRAPVQIEVQAYELDLTNKPVPLPNALVLVDRSSDRIRQVPVAGPLLGVGPGLSAPRPIGAAVRAPALVLPPEPLRTLSSGVSPGATEIEVDNRGALAVGDLVAIDRTVPERAEWVEVTTIDASADAFSPARLGLRYQLRHGHRGGDTVRRVVAPTLGPTVSTTTRLALAGDRTLAVSSLTAVTSGQVLKITGGAQPPEYRTAALYNARTTGDGIAVLPPMSGLAAVRVRALLGGLGAAAQVTLSQATATRRLQLTLV